MIVCVCLIERTKIIANEMELKSIILHIIIQKKMSFYNNKDSNNLIIIHNNNTQN